MFKFIFSRAKKDKADDVFSGVPEYITTIIIEQYGSGGLASRKKYSRGDNIRSAFFESFKH